MPIYSSALNGIEGRESVTIRRHIADGAIVLGAGKFTLVALATIQLDMTLAPPAQADSGKILIIWSEIAQAHTVTCAVAGFNGGGAASDVGTFGAALGNGFTCVACGGNWWVTSNRNVVFA